MCIRDRSKTSHHLTKFPTVYTIRRQQTSQVQQPGHLVVVPERALVQLRGFCLVCDSSSSSCSSLRVAEVGMADWLEVLVQLVHERDARRDVQLDDVVIADAVEVLHEGADRVAMGDDDNLPTGLHRRRDRLFPVRDEPCDGVLETCLLYTSPSPRD